MTLLYNGMARLTHIGAETEDLFIALIYYGTSLLFIVIGNYLPKIKQNNTIGIRIVWILQDEENWNATHSFSGRIWGDIRYFMYAVHITFDKICE